METQDARLLKLESKTENIETKISEIYITLKDISETLKELKDIQLNQVRLEGEILDIRNQLNGLQKDIDISFKEIHKVKEKGTDVCSLHQSDIKEIRSIYQGQCELIKQSMHELKNMTSKLEQSIKERDKLFIGLVITIVAQVIWGVIKLL